MARTLSAAPPRIDYQPKDQTVILYQLAAFGVIASGTAPLTYQWRKDSVPIAGATNDQIVLGHAQFSDAGLYSVLVTNGEGTATSVEALLTVNPPLGGDVDCSFTCGGSINETVLSVVMQADRKILMGGQFSTVYGVARGGIARLNANGTTDHTFMNGLAGANYKISSVAVQGDGKVLIGGAFTQVNGATRHGIARLHADGSLDNDFQNGLAGANGAVSSLALQDDGKILIGGDFTAVNGMERTRIARLNADGSLDTGFQFGLSGANSNVLSLAVRSDGKVLIGGGFTSVNGMSRRGIARLHTDGTLDSGFQDGLSGVNREVYSVALQSDGKVLIGGAFTNVNGVSRRYLARLTEEGALDGTFLGAPTFYVYSMAVQTNDRVLLGGSFNAVNLSLRGRVARLHANGSLDNAFRDPDCGPSVYAVAGQSDGKVLVGGSFITVQGASRSGMARLNSDGVLDSGFQNGLSGPNEGVFSMRLQSDGKLVIGGRFTTIGGVPRSYIARLHADGTLDRSFQEGLSGANDWIFSVALQTDGKVLIGGLFATVNGVSRNRIARLHADGSVDTGFQNGLSGASYIVNSIALQSDGKVLIGGVFTNVNGVSRNHIARLNADGTLDTGFQNGLGGTDRPVTAVAVQSDGRVLIGGSFFTVNGVSHRHVARLHADGSLDTNFLNALSGPSYFLSSLAAQSDGKVLIGGFFTAVNGVSRNRIARLNGDGTLDSGFLNGLSGADDAVLSVAVQSGGKVLLGGYFSTVNDAARNHVARLNADGTLDTSFLNERSGADHIVECFASQRDGQVLIGGGFTSVNGVPAAYIARLWSSADIPPLIKSITRSGRDVALIWDSIPNRTYRVQYKGSLSPGEWMGFSGDVLATSGTASQTDTTLGDAAQRFYRVLLLP